jgi:hypothetical protein
MPHLSPSTQLILCLSFNRNKLPSQLRRLFASLSTRRSRFHHRPIHLWTVVDPGQYMCELWRTQTSTRVNCGGPRPVYVWTMVDPGQYTCELGRTQANTRVNWGGPKPVHVRIAADKVAPDEVSLRLLGFSPVSIIQPTPLTHSFITDDKRLTVQRNKNHKRLKLCTLYCLARVVPIQGTGTVLAITRVSPPPKTSRCVIRTYPNQNTDF